ncbi:MAG: UDP-4-amino-4,6-dideoxy-N-acetyl-beta-L-altrosamine transaminase [Candidatus Magasanikbacteria bacterium]|nr:UDP-4-amino-4,6-dideoxy-N-acetyl-beta-L-altrosamine transaminase [Candidatus Magasanikbacteria bacterium]
MIIPYGRQSIGADDIAAVEAVLRSDRLTQGPKVEEFEQALAEYCGARFAVVTSSGTSALHTAYAAVGLSAGDEIISSPITFPATTNAALWQGAKPVFVDVESKTGNINVDLIKASITSKTKAIVPVDYTGRPVNLAAIKKLAQQHNLVVIEDACQALGATYHGKKIGSISDLTVFSFHPVKSITTGEGGAVLTDNENWYKKMKMFVTHGVTKAPDNLTISSPGAWYFEMQLLGNNYRLTDLQAALGISQLKKLDQFVARRRELVTRYSAALADQAAIVTPPADSTSEESAWHLYVIQLQGKLSGQRAEMFKKLQESGVGVQVHHMLSYYHPYYQKLGYLRGACPRAEAWYESIISLPLYPDLTLADQDYVIKTVKDFAESLQK